MKTNKPLAPILILCLFVGIVAAQGNERESLRGIGAVGVAIVLNSDAKEGGLTEDRLRTTAELGLRRNGIATGSRLTILRVEATAIDATLVSGERPGYVVHIGVYLTGLVTIAANDLAISAQFWRAGYLMVTSEDAFVRDVLDKLEEYVDRFSNDYLAVNPK